MSDRATNFSEQIASQSIASLMDKIPYAKFIGVQCIEDAGDLLFVLPKNDINIGNPTLPAIHGGVIGGFMETAATLHILAKVPCKRVPKVINIALDYLSPGRHRDSYARCELVRQGRNIINVRVTAFQGDESRPVATARAHFLL